MTDSYLFQLLVEALAKHLPPSASTLRLADVTGTVAPTLAVLRPDCAALPITPEAHTHDAAVGIGELPAAPTLAAALRVLRPGGRLIWIAPDEAPTADRLIAIGALLEGAGFVRILVEPVTGGAGVLLRGEQAHEDADTAARIAVAADHDAAVAGDDLAAYGGRFLFLLIRQTPYKPAWAIAPGEVIRWEAAAITTPDAPVLLAFSSLPKAVAFMQPALMTGRIRDIHRIAKFPRTAAAAWPGTVRLNPPVAALDGVIVHLIPVDPAAAVTGDE